MSHYYEYDVFLSCAYEDKDAAEFFRRRLQELDFLAWFSLPETEKDEEDFTENAARAVEDSATCVFLVGNKGKAPWLNDAIRSVIQRRLWQEKSTLRVLTVMLPQTRSDFATALIFLTKNYSNHHHWPLIRCNDELNDKVIDELVLGIRGINLRASSGVSNRIFSAGVHARAQSALNVDWNRLSSDILKSYGHYDEREINLQAARQFDRWLSPENVGKASLQGERSRILSVASCDQTAKEPWDIHSSTNTSIPISRAVIAAGWIILMGVLLAYCLLNQNEVQHEAVQRESSPIVKGKPKSILTDEIPMDQSTQKVAGNITLPKSVSTTSQAKSDIPDSHDKVNEFGQTIHAETSLYTTHPFAHNSPSSNLVWDKARGSWDSKTDRSSKPKSEITLTTVPGSFKKTSEHEPIALMKSRIVELSEVEAPPDIEFLAGWKESSMDKLAKVKKVTIELSTDLGLGAEFEARVIKEFGHALREIGIDVVTQKTTSTQTDGMVSLEFGQKEIKSGLVWVALRDNRGQIVTSQVTSTSCDTATIETLRIALCNASQRLSNKMGTVILNARNHN